MKRLVPCEPRATGRTGRCLSAVSRPNSADTLSTAAPAPQGNRLGYRQAVLANPLEELVTGWSWSKSGGQRTKRVAIRYSGLRARD